MTEASELADASADPSLLLPHLEDRGGRQKMACLKSFAFLTLFASALLLSAVSSESAQMSPPKPKQHESLTEKQTPKAEGNQASANPTPSEKNPETSGVVREGAAQEKQNDAYHLRPEATVAEWIMVGITSAYVIVAFFTLMAIKRQADLAERAVGNLERPWINIKLISLRDGPSGNQETLTVVRYSFVNHGRSPGWITRSWLDFRRIKVSDLPQTPNYAAAPASPHMNIPPSRATPATQVGVPLSAHEALEIASSPREKTLMLFGYIEYTDVFGKQHDTRFCFFYNPPAAGKIPAMPMPGSLQVDGPMSYTRQT